VDSKRRLLVRSYVQVDATQILNNKGLHGNWQECGPIELSASAVLVYIVFSAVFCMLAELLIYCCATSKYGHNIRQHPNVILQ
jgi:hypothetical protein